LFEFSQKEGREMALTGSIRFLMCVAAMTFALASAANASPLVRTFISNAGNDSNASGGGCVVTAPCRTLAGAYPDTESGGEIVMMNPGGYGCLTITTPLSILGTDGATSTATSGACIVISAGSTDKVYIRNLEITGANVSGTIGIQLNTGNLILRNCGLKYLTTGLVVGNNSATVRADVINTDIIGNTTGIETNGTGSNVSSGNPVPGAAVLVRLKGGNSVDNTTAFYEQNPGVNTPQINDTFYMFSPSSGLWSMSVTGYTTLLSSSVTAADPPYPPSMLLYNSSGPN
jgi:hypothetical protein